MTYNINFFALLFFSPQNIKSNLFNLFRKKFLYCTKHLLSNLFYLDKLLLLCQASELRVDFNCFVIGFFRFICLSNLSRAFPLLYQALESCGLILIALSYAFMASSNLFKCYRASPLFTKHLNFAG